MSTIYFFKLLPASRKLTWAEWRKSIREKNSTVQPNTTKSPSMSILREGENEDHQDDEDSF